MKDEPKLDHARLTFPSDEMKLGAASYAIKRMHNKSHQPNLDLVHSAFDNVYAMMDAERRLAEQAFAKHLGRPDPYADDSCDRDETIRMLAQDYERYGLASGISHTKELARSIEKQAADQAQEYSGKSL
ncbi:hypothetical protein AB1L88_25865 [Tautonia sp. JC769]|uniref:hypothetical protein n=1 Tax=Tautonia sp. JC769 TaxID=3232135 RepID=UPI003457F78F